MTKYLAAKVVEEKSCWSEALGEKEEEEGKEKRSMWETAALSSSGETTDNQGIFSTFGNLSMLLVQPDALLRFQPAQVCFFRFFFGQNLEVDEELFPYL